LLDNNNSTTNITSLVDAQFAKCTQRRRDHIEAAPIDNHPMAKSPCDNFLTMKQMLKYKAIIMLEGNDVASGLKWALFSQSVVMMPPPTQISWAMELELEPWVHYVPIEGDLSNVNEQMQWILDNDLAAQRIAERGTLYIYDLMYHPQALADEQVVKHELLKLYWSAL